MEPHPHRMPGLTFAAIAAELTREASHRLTFYQRQIEKGRMTDREARFELSLVDAWQADLARMQAAYAPLRHGRPASLPMPPEHRITWRDRHTGLLRELALRARVYARKVAAGEADQATADHRLACLRALLLFYDDGLDWPTDPQQRADLHAEITSRLTGAEPQQELALA